MDAGELYNRHDINIVTQDKQRKGVTVQMPTLTKDAQYKDGYQVGEGGDYLVSSVPYSSGGYTHVNHIVTRIADGRLIGTYLSRQAACKRAQQFGGNTPASRRVAQRGKSIKSVSRLAYKQERVAAERLALDHLTAQTTKAMERERDEELDELYTAHRNNVPGAINAIEEHHRTDYVKSLEEIVSESKLLENDARFSSAGMKKYLRQYSLGRVRTKSMWGDTIGSGTGLPNNAYRRVHVEAAWLALPAKKRLQRMKQNYLLRRNLECHGISEDGLTCESVSLREEEPWRLEAIAEVLKKFPLPDTK